MVNGFWSFLVSPSGLSMCPLRYPVRNENLPVGGGITSSGPGAYYLCPVFCGTAVFISPLSFPLIEFLLGSLPPTEGTLVAHSIGTGF